MAAPVLAMLGLLQAAPALATSFHTLATVPSACAYGCTSNLSGLAADPQGRLYGASAVNGANGFGYIYRLTPGTTKSDPWTSETLHDFTAAEGTYPEGGVTIGAGGEIYGTAASGGAYGGGIAFRLDNVAGWPLTTLHAFGAKRDVGYNPRGALVFGPQGLLYGTTQFAHNQTYSGDVFALSPLGDTVSYAVIHQFYQAPGPDGGYQLNGNLVAAPDGDLYGTARAGGLTPSSQGVFFKLSQNAAGSWQYLNLHDFIAGVGDFFPLAPVRASDGTFYGCSSNGRDATGSVYALTPPRPGVAGWTESTVTVFPSHDHADVFALCQAVAVMPTSGLIVTNSTERTASTGGRVLELMPPAAAGGSWTAVTVHSFHPDGNEKYYPSEPLLRIGGLYYGVTAPADLVDGGTVYDVRP